MSERIQIEIVTPESAVFAGEATSVLLPTSLGEVGILPMHRPMVSLLEGGTLEVAGEGETRRFAVGAGFAEVGTEKISVVVASCDDASEIDVENARQELAELEKEAAEHNLLDEAAEIEMSRRLARQRARVRIAEHATKGR